MHRPLALNDNLPIEEALRLIDKDIDDAIEKYNHAISILVNLKSQRNALAPVSRLPPEILCRIFSLLKEAEPGTSLAPMILTHVSSHWRNVGINLPSLWTQLPLTKPSWVEEMLVRSKEAPLIISINAPCQRNHTYGLKQAVEHTRRIKEVSILFDIEEWCDWGEWGRIYKILPMSTPCLERLRIVNLLPGQASWASTFSMPEDIFRETPKLRHLELTNLILNWHTHSHLLHALTHLKLNNILPHDSMPKWRRFARILEGMPGLEVLHLEKALPVVDNTLADEPVSIHLSALQDMFISCCEEEAEIFFSCITYPPTAMVKIACYGFRSSVTDSDTVDFAGFLMRLSRSYSDTLLETSRFQTLILGKIEEAQTRPITNPGFRLKLFFDELSDKMLADNTISPNLDIIFDWRLPGHLDTHNFSKAMHDVFGRGLPLQDISRVYLTERLNHLGADTLADTVGRLSKLHSFVAGKMGGRVLLDALQLTVHDGSAKLAIATPYYFPKLSSICFHKSPFRLVYSQTQGATDIRTLDPVLNSRVGHEPVQKAYPEDDLDYIPIELLSDCLIQRTSSGAGLPTLTFRHCPKLFKRDVDFLVKIGHVVE